MVALSLPEPMQRGLRDLAAISESDFAVFIDALKAIPVEITQHSVFPDIAIPGFTDNAESIKSAVFSLILAQASDKGPPYEIVDGAIAALAKSSQLNEDVQSAVRHRLNEVFSIESLRLIAKSHEILSEHAGTFSSARVLTDIRPVFGNDVNSKPDAAVIVHMLNINYFNNRNREQFSVALDEQDIDQLIDVLERAKQKQITLRDIIKNSNMLYVGVR